VRSLPALLGAYTFGRGSRVEAVEDRGHGCPPVGARLIVGLIAGTGMWRCVECGIADLATAGHVVEEWWAESRVLAPSQLAGAAQTSGPAHVAHATKTYGRRSAAPRRSGPVCTRPRPMAGSTFRLLRGGEVSLSPEADKSPPLWSDFSIQPPGDLVPQRGELHLTQELTQDSGSFVSN